MRRSKEIILSLILLILVVVFTWKHWINRTPDSIFRNASDIVLVDKVELEIFEDVWGDNGDGHSLVSYKIDESQLQDVIKQAVSNNYQLLPCPVKKIKNIELSDRGYYRLKYFHDTTNYLLAVVDIKHHRVISFEIIQ